MRSADNKKGSTADAVVWIIMLFVIGLFLPIGFMVVTSINSGFQGVDDGLLNHSNSKQIMGSLENQFPSLFDGIFLMMVVGLAIISIIFALLIRSNPAFYFVGIIVVIVILFIAGILANEYSAYSESSAIAEFSAAFPIMNFVFDNFVLMIMVLVSLVAITIWAKTR